MNKKDSMNFDIEAERMSLRKTLATNIRQQRKKLGLTQAALAEKTGMTTESIGKIETLKQALSEESILKISVALNITPGILFNNPETDNLIKKDLIVESTLPKLAEILNSTNQKSYKTDHSKRI